MKLGTMKDALPAASRQPISSSAIRRSLGWDCGLLSPLRGARAQTQSRSCRADRCDRPGCTAGGCRAGHEQRQFRRDSRRAARALRERRSRPARWERGIPGDAGALRDADDDQAPSLWRATAVPAPATAALEGRRRGRRQIAIVGARATPVFCALALAEGGPTRSSCSRRGEIGHGASGRNGGSGDTWTEARSGGALSRASAASARRSAGPAVGGAADRVFALIATSHRLRARPMRMDPAGALGRRQQTIVERAPPVGGADAHRSSCWRASASPALGYRRLPRRLARPPRRARCNRFSLRARARASRARRRRAASIRSRRRRRSSATAGMARRDAARAKSRARQIVPRDRCLLGRAVAGARCQPAWSSPACRRRPNRFPMRSGERSCRTRTSPPTRAGCCTIFASDAAGRFHHRRPRIGDRRGLRRDRTRPCSALRPACTRRWRT